MKTSSILSLLIIKVVLELLSKKVYFPLPGAN